MTLAVLVAISAMWFSVAVFFLGKGEAKGTGAITAFVGAVTVLGAILQAAVFKDPFVAGLLFVHGIFYCSVAYALLAGLEDLRSVGNVALNTCIVSVIYTLIFLVGGPEVGGKVLVAQSSYLAFACLIYSILTLMVWLNAYGKFPTKALAVSLLVGIVLSLWIPAFYLMVAGRLPF
ncbi:MAG: transporter [Deltaproteobacteria bacterium]|nr:transporter [Deltaproteobacteria bacterium]